MSFIDASYFIAEKNIPDSENVAVAERLVWFIQKYEPDFLQKLMGYSLYKAFIAGMYVDPPAVPNMRFINLLYGTEYTNERGDLAKWRGLIVTDSPTLNLTGNYVYKRPQYITAGATADFDAGVNTATFTDWIGWKPIIMRTGVMIPDVDYSWDSTTGEMELLIPGDVFGNGETFFVQFEQRANGPLVPVETPNESCIANYVYFFYYKSLATQTSGIGEVRTNAENARPVSQRSKLCAIWNEMHEWVKEFICYMQSTEYSDPFVYPEWTYGSRNQALKSLGFMNPIF